MQETLFVFHVNEPNCYRFLWNRKLIFVGILLVDELKRNVMLLSIEFWLLFISPYKSVDWHAFNLIFVSLNVYYRYKFCMKHIDSLLSNELIFSSKNHSNLFTLYVGFQFFFYLFSLSSWSKNNTKYFNCKTKTAAGKCSHWFG